MQQKFLPVVLLLSAMAVSCGSAKHTKSKAMPGTWQAQPITVDGDSKDWPSPYPNYDAKSMVAYATSNDRENLYITMQTGDEKTQVKILKQGLTVSIDTGGRKDPQFNINFPLQNENDLIEMPRHEEGQKSEAPLRSGRLLDQKIKKSAGESTQFSLDGFINCNGGFLVSQSSPCGIKVMVRIDEYKELVWEAVVPFKAIYNKSYITAADAGKPISVCFSVKGLKNPGSKSNNDNVNGGMNNGMAGGGMHNSMQGRGGAGRGRTPDNPYQQLYENTKTWKIFGLAYQQ